MIEDLRKYESFQSFIYDLALELTADAKDAFIMAGGDNDQKETFLSDLSSAMKAISATDKWTMGG